MTNVYTLLASITKAEVIVDSSKRPSNAAALRFISGIDPYFLHLVRDSRGVAYSRRRPKLNPDGAGKMPIDSIGFSAVDWMATNVVAGAVTRHFPGGRSMFLRYEDFVANPMSTIERVVALVGQTVRHDPFIDPHTVNLGANHTVSGNADRFRTGSVPLRPDVEWMYRMRSLERRITTLLTLPLLQVYGYSVFPSASSNTVVGGSATERRPKTSQRAPGNGEEPK
jgi:hypothetical protein